MAIKNFEGVPIDLSDWSEDLLGDIGLSKEMIDALKNPGSTDPYVIAEVRTNKDGTLDVIVKKLKGDPCKEN